MGERGLAAMRKSDAHNRIASHCIASVIAAPFLHIDDTALDGSPNVTIYGEINTEAQRFAEEFNISFIPANDDTPVYQPAQPPVTLPYVALV